MEMITVEWCEKNNFKKQSPNVVRDVTYYYEVLCEFIISYTQSGTGLRSIAIGLFKDKDYISYECKRPIDVHTLKKMCELLNINYPFDN